MKRLLNFFSTIFDIQSGTALQEYITWKRPQNHADLERIVQEFNELRYW